MAAQRSQSDEQERLRHGQSAARGDTGDGRTGVPSGEQGISNRPGDAEAASAEDDDEAADDVEPDDEDATADEDDADEDEDDDEDDDDEDDEDAEDDA